MDKDLKKVIEESLQEFFESEPAKMIERGTRPEYFDVCPHCKKEIYEKHEYTEDGGKTWRHSDCKGLITRPPLDPSEIPSWLRPYMEQVEKERLDEVSYRIYNDTLCPKLWDENQHLDPEVRLNLLRMAYDFYKKTKFTAPIIDVWFMGSAANYNWTPESDADVHVIIDFSKLQMPNETASKVAKAAGAQWNNEHNAYVKGHKVEINIQSVKAEKPYITGIYSLVKDEWVRKPSHLNVKIDKSLIQTKYAGMKKYVETVIASGDRERMKAAKDYLDAFRQYGLDNGGELSIENIVYKILRSKGLIKGLKSAIVAAYDKQMSVDEVREDGPHNINGEHFKITFGHSDISKLAGKIFLGNEWFANVYPSSYNDDEWAINAHTGAFNHKFQSPDYTFTKLEDVLAYLEEWYSKQGMNEEKKVTYKDIPAKFPLPPALWKGQPNLRMMTLSNLKSQRDKEGRFAKSSIGGEDKSQISHHLKMWKMYDDEIKRRLKYINAPVTEGHDPHYNAHVDFLERRDSQMCEIAGFLKDNPVDKNIPWNTVPATLLKKTWLVFGKYNRVNVNDIDKIADQILTNIARLYVSNEFTGHSTNYYMREEVADSCGIEFTEEEWDRNTWRFENISDYGMEPLQKIYTMIFNADTPEEKLYACDKALNVVHQRSDLAEMFVEGGTRTLNAVANQGGYNAGYEYGDVNKMMRSVDEKLVHSFETNYGRGDNYVEVFQNPTTKELKECKPHYEIGALLTDKDMYVWDREKAYHNNVKTQLKLPEALSLLLIPDNSNINRMDILVTDAVKGTKWDDNPQTAAFIRNHPFFRGKQIDHIMYWNEDIVGDWSKLKPEVAEGYGAGIPETDRLHIAGHRWQIRSKDAPKTPKLTDEEQEIVNEIVNVLVKEMV